MLINKIRGRMWHMDLREGVREDVDYREIGKYGLFQMLIQGNYAAPGKANILGGSAGPPNLVNLTSPSFNFSIRQEPLNALFFSITGKRIFGTSLLLILISFKQMIYN